VQTDHVINGVFPVDANVLLLLWQRHAAGRAQGPRPLPSEVFH